MGVDLVGLAKAAGIGGVALGVVLLLFREFIRKSVFANLTKEQSYRLLGLFLILTWSVGVLGLILWQAPALLLGAPQAKRVVLLMDSTARAVIYDERSRDEGRTNADDISDALKGLPGLQVDKETTSLNWNRFGDVVSKNPDLIVIHASAFYSETASYAPGQGNHDYEKKFESFLGYMSKTKSQLLLYSRASFWQTEEGRQAVAKVYAKRFPFLANRLRVFPFPRENEFSFRDQATATRMRQQVSELLKLRE